MTLFRVTSYAEEFISVLTGKIVRPGVWWGTPVQPLDEYKRQNAHLKGLERLKAEVKEIKKDIKSRSD